MSCANSDEEESPPVCTEECLNGHPCGLRCIAWGEVEETIGRDMQPYSNPMQLYDDQGWQVPFTQSPYFAGPVFINIESIRRNMTKFPFSNSFQIVLPIPLHGVRSIELVDFCMPTLIGCDDKPRSNYYFLANGLVTNYQVDVNGEPISGKEGTFTPQGLVRLYHTMESEENTFMARNIANFSFAKLYYKSNEPVQIWERQNARKVYYLKPEMSTLAILQFSLLDNEALPLKLQKLPLAPEPKASEDEWTCTLMVTARSK